MAGVAALAGPSPTSASSHREAPLIAGDPRADNTDVYAFVSPDAPDTVSLIANWLPFEEPNGGPNFYTWAEDTRYNIKIDNNGDAMPDLTYTWTFTTVTRDPGQFLYNTGPITSIDDPDLNVLPDLRPDRHRRRRDPDAPARRRDRGTVARRTRVGPRLHAPLMAEATKQLPGGGQSYVGQADDPFFLDLRSSTCSTVGTSPRW